MTGGLSGLANKLETQGRHGDTILVHMAPEELRLLEHLAGVKSTINPVTGLPEAFSLGKLLAGIGMGIAGGVLLATGVGGAAAPYLFSMAGGFVGGAFAPDGSGSAAEAQKLLDAKNAKDSATQYKFSTDGAKQTQIYGQTPVSITGQEHNNFVQPTPIQQQPVPGAADGGALAPKLEPEEQKVEAVKQAAMMAIMGRLPPQEAAKAVNAFIAMFGKDALQKLAQSVQGGPGTPLRPPLQAPPQAAPAPAMAAGGLATPQGYERGGLISGPGGGLDDLALAKTDSGNKLLVGDGEYVVTADVVSALGGGSNKAGARKLDAMMVRTRTMAHGHPQQIKPVDEKKALPA